jgi:hypothetical protein
VAGGAGLLGFAYFAAVKFVGYSVAARFLSSRYQTAPNARRWCLTVHWTRA